MPFFDGIVTHSNAYGQLLSLERGEIKGIGIYDTIADRGQQPQGNPAATNMVRGFLAIVKDADGSGTTKAYFYTGPHNPNANPEVSSEDWQNAANWTEVGEGSQGDPGPAGQDGVTFTPAVNPVVGSLNPGSTPTVSITSATTSATEGVMTFSFSLAQGEQGVQGPTGNDGTTFTPVITQVDSLNPASAATASVNAANGEAQFTFGIPRGEQGLQGTQGTVGPAGATGETGATGSAGTTYTPDATATTLAAGSNATVTVSVSGSTATYSFGIPRGSDGSAGANGTTFTPAVESNTLEPGADATATVTSNASEGVATYTFGIPRGETGAVGPTGPAGSISELTNVSSDPVASSFLFATAGTTSLSPFSFSGGLGIDITEGTSSIDFKIDLGELPSISGNGGDSVTEVIANGNNGDGFRFSGYDSNQDDVYVDFTDLIAALGFAYANQAVSEGYGTVDNYGGESGLGDIDGDGLVGVNDILTILSNFASTPGTVPNTTVTLTDKNFTTDAETGADIHFPDLIASGSYTAGDKFYLPINDESGTTTNYHTSSGGAGVQLTTTGSTDGSDDIAFIDASGTPYEVAGLNGPRKISMAFFKSGTTNVSIFKQTDAVEEVTLGFDIEYHDTSGVISGYSASCELLTEQPTVAGDEIGGSGISFGLDLTVSAILNAGASFEFNGNNQIIPPTSSTPVALKFKPWIKSSNGQTIISGGNPTGTYTLFQINLRN